MKRFLSLLLLVLVFFTASNVYASETNGTIISGGNNGYAWSNQAGWVNFGDAEGNIHITDLPAGQAGAGITGYAWNAKYGWINMNPTNGGIAIAANGTLSGHAWGSSLGWINFSGVSINSSGEFTGTASGTIVGTLAFDCANCSVTTDYRPADFRTTITPTPTPSGGGGGGGGGSSPSTPTTPAIPTVPDDSPTPAPDETTPNPETTFPPSEETPGTPGAPTTPTTPGGSPAPGLDTPTFPPRATPTDSVGSSDTGGEDSLLPAQLFDIRLLLDSANVSRVIDLVARVTFESFGRVPTPVSMTFSIHDETGRDVWKSVDTVTVETEQVFVRRFFNTPTLAPGNYTLHLTTLYNTDVQDDFEAPFTIEPKGAGWNWELWFVGGLLLLLAILVFVWWLIMRRRKEQEKRGLYIPLI